MYFKTYKPHFACFKCQKVFKKTAIQDYFKQTGRDMAYKKLSTCWIGKGLRNLEKKLGVTLKELEMEYYQKVSTCPECGAKMANMGFDFKAPKKNDKQAWEIAEHCYLTWKQQCGAKYPWR